MDKFEKSMDHSEEPKKPVRSKFVCHTSILIWKCFLQRQRRWRLLVLETMLTGILFLIAIFTAKPVFLNPLHEEPIPALQFDDILDSFDPEIVLGYSPNVEPFSSVMVRAKFMLNTTSLEAATEDGLNDLLYLQSLASKTTQVIWVIFQPKRDNVWSFSIRSTERARSFHAQAEKDTFRNPHLRVGFLAVQIAVSHSILVHDSSTLPKYHLKLMSMPVTPMMQEERVHRTLSILLLFFTLGLLPPVMETQALVVTETQQMLKRALRLRNVGYSSLYLSWLAYGYFTAMPACILGAITLILLFRWVHLMAALVILLEYTTVMLMLALIMAMFHSKAHLACIWSILFTLLLTYLAELVIVHKWNAINRFFTFVLQLLLPPLGLIEAFNEFALQQTGIEKITESSNLLIILLVSWGFMALLSYGILMLLQHTQQRAIGGQVEWKTIIFKTPENISELHPIEPPMVTDNSKVQVVDEFVAKAITFKNVTKMIMGETVLENIQFDIYRNEFTILLSDSAQEQMLITILDLCTGLSFPDHGEINVLGEKLEPGTNIMSSVHMMGYCHRAETLIDDLTVEEHLNVFNIISLWHRSIEDAFEYGEVRTKALIKECDLERVVHERIRDLDMYYKAQLCWALALLLEPRIIMVPNFIRDSPLYTAIIKDKIVQYKNYLTIITLSFSSLNLEYADRVFMFDMKKLMFGGTPAFMFFKYGRGYRMRIMLSSWKADERTSQLLQRAALAGATVRAHLGHLLILRLPASPTEIVAQFVKDLADNPDKYGVYSFNLSIADSHEICRRAVGAARKMTSEINVDKDNIMHQALEKLSDPVAYKRRTSKWNLHLSYIAWKFVTYHKLHNRLFCLTIVVSLVAGLILGLSLSSVLKHLNKATKLVKEEVLSVEEGQNTQKTTLMVRMDYSTEAMSIAKAYVMSDTNASKNAVDEMEYTALSFNERASDYLAVQAIDSPQSYVYKYAYGLSVSNATPGYGVHAHALYSPLHQDQAAAARSIARVYMALIRHFTNTLDASIKVSDDPLALDLSPWLKDLVLPPLLVQFFLILTISHITLLPSEEYGLIRHVQKHASDFSPLRYWLTHYFCDLIFYWLLVMLTSAVMILVLLLKVPFTLITPLDLFVVPIMLLVYGVGCIPQAYIFSMGPHVALNTLAYMMFNLVFGETTILATFLYGDTLTYALVLMSLSPQFNMAYAFVKIRQIFAYNSECVIFQNLNLCTDNTMHKCCKKCGILQECFVRKHYFDPGILREILALFVTAFIFTIILLLIDCQFFARVWLRCTRKLALRDLPPMEKPQPGYAQELQDVEDKKKQLISGKARNFNTFGEHLLVSNVTMRDGGEFVLRNVSLGIGKGEAVALSGMERHGRRYLCRVLAGYEMPTDGDVWAMSKWRIRNNRHLYSQNVSLSCDRSPLPPWQLVSDALRLLAVLRGVPVAHVAEEIKDLADALDMSEILKKRVCNLTLDDRPRVHFVAAVIGAPPIIIIDETMSGQSYLIRTSMYAIIDSLRKRGHAIFVSSSSSVERHLPVTNRLAIIRDGCIVDLDTADKYSSRYSVKKGYTVVVQLKHSADIASMFEKHFSSFTVNDMSDVLVNLQVEDKGLTIPKIFERMEQMKEENPIIDSYIVTTTPIDYIYNLIMSKEMGNKPSEGVISSKYFKKILSYKSKLTPPPEALNKLKCLEIKYDITTLKELPWSVIFHTD